MLGEIISTCQERVRKTKHYFENFGMARICALHGCRDVVYVDESGVPGEYCSLRHKRWAKEEEEEAEEKELKKRCCLLCREVEAPVAVGHGNFCSRTCALNAGNQAPCLLKVPKTHDTFDDVRHQFKNSWRHPKKRRPHVRAIYKIVCSNDIDKSYETYRASVDIELRNGVKGRNVGKKLMKKSRVYSTPGNERRRWHGTNKGCSLGDKGNLKRNVQPCFSQTCSLCRIIRSSFNIDCFGQKTGRGRFGRGIYTSSTSSKADDYSQNIISTSGGTQSEWKALLLNKVVVGRGRELTQGDPTITCPPPGFHSIIGNPGDELRYDELVVYNNNAIKPSYLVMYETRK